jgi:hypothetical protein
MGRRAGQSLQTRLYPVLLDWRLHPTYLPEHYAGSRNHLDVQKVWFCLISNLIQLTSSTDNGPGCSLDISHFGVLSC